MVLRTKKSLRSEMVNGIISTNEGFNVSEMWWQAPLAASIGLFKERS